MKNSIKNSIRASVLMAALSLTFSACSDWTEYESLGVKTPSLENQNPELYAAYLESLRAYKAGAHKVVFVTLENNTAAPSKQAERLSAVPDSVDYISMNNPANLDPAYADDMAAVRKKGTKVIYDVDFTVFESEWMKMVKEDKDGNLTEEDGLAYITARTEERLALCDRFDFDGLTITYPGRALVSLPADDLVVYTNRQKAFLDAVMAWRATHESKSFSFIGNTQFLVDANKAFLTSCDYIMLVTDMASNAPDISIRAVMAVESGNVPSDRFVAVTQTVRPGDKDQLYGYFGSRDDNGNKVRSIGGTAQWVGEPSADYTRAGMLIRNAQYDYYDTSLAYRYIRAAIETMNPSPKN